jgi:hypothetical protein
MDFRRLKTAREQRSVAGPCTILGPVLQETDRYISYRDRHGMRKFISKRWAVHSTPCPLCPDHPKTKYPDEFYE